MKTFRREGEFSAEKLNLPYSSGPIWDLSLLTAPQGTAVIFCTACTPRNTLLNQRMSARARAQLTAPGAERLVNSTTTPRPPADPEVHPQTEDYWGHVNPIGPRACYDEGKRVAETMCYAYMKQVSRAGGVDRSLCWIEYS